MLLGSIVLCGFVFARHTQNTQRPVFTLKVAPWPFALATGAGLATALFWHFAIDPWLRIKAPADYPTTMEQWLAMTLFSLGLKQLFVVFAPFAWLIRLFGRKESAFILTVVFGLTFVVAGDQGHSHNLMQQHRQPALDLPLQRVPEA